MDKIPDRRRWLGSGLLCDKLAALEEKERGNSLDSVARRPEVHQDGKRTRGNQRIKDRRAGNVHGGTHQRQARLALATRSLRREALVGNPALLATRRARGHNALQIGGEDATHDL